MIFKLNHTFMRINFMNRIQSTSNVYLRSFSNSGNFPNKFTIKKNENKIKSNIFYYISKYESFIEKRFPRISTIYNMFSIGLKDFFVDLKLYVSIKIKLLNDDNFTKLSRKEIEIYHKTPGDIWKISPVLIFIAIPFGNFLIFPLAMIKPRSVLCSHFWSIQQKGTFALLDLKDRLINNRTIFRELQFHIDQIKDENLHKKWLEVIALIGSGVHPSTQSILQCKELFITGPYNLENLTFKHTRYLCKAHGIRWNIFPRRKLRHKAFLIKEMDKAILREGGVAVLNRETLQNICFLRGLNASNLNNATMIDWINQWMEISRTVDSDSWSLLLHSPILLAYNHPQNWILIY